MEHKETVKIVANKRTKNIASWKMSEKTNISEKRIIRQYHSGSIYSQEQKKGRKTQTLGSCRRETYGETQSGGCVVKVWEQERDQTLDACLKP